MDACWIERIEDFEKWAPAWDRALRGSKEDNPFVHSEFIQTWWKHYGQGYRLRIFVLTEGDQVVGGLPLFEDSAGRLEHIGRNAANYTEFLIAPGRQQIWDPFLAALSKRKGWRQVLIKRVRQDRLHFSQALVRAHPELLVQAPQTELTHGVSIPDDFSRIGQQIHRRLWSLVKRMRNKIHRMGPVRLETVETPDRLRRFMEQFIQFSKMTFRDRGMRSNFEAEAFCRFFTELVDRFLKRGFLEAKVLWVKDQVLAMSFGYSLGDNRNIILSTYNPAWAHLRPGHLMIYHLLEEGSRLGKPLMDFYTGQYRYKEHWSSRRDPVHTVEIRPRCLRGWLAHAVSTGRWGLRGYSRSHPHLHRWVQKVRGVRIN